MRKKFYSDEPKTSKGKVTDSNPVGDVTTRVNTLTPAFPGATTGLPLGTARHNVPGARNTRLQLSGAVVAHRIGKR